MRKGLGERLPPEAVSFRTTSYPHSPIPGLLHLVPQPVQYLEPRVAYVDAACGGEALDSLKALGELHVRPVQRERRMHTELATEVHDGEEQVAQLLLEQRIGNAVARRRRAARDLGADLAQLLLHFFGGAA